MPKKWIPDQVGNDKEDEEEYEMPKQVRHDKEGTGK